MKDKSFLIKISDLLNETGKSDDIAFEGKFVETIPTLTPEGISGSLIIQSVWTDALLGTLHDLSCRVNELCDSCGTTYTREIHIPEYTAKFVVEESLSKEEEEATDEAILFINEKDETIDISQMIEQAIVLNEPFAKRCAECEKRLSTEDDDEDLGDFVSTGNINFS